MAAASTSFVASSGVATLVTTKGLSSGNAFQTSSTVQFAPLRSQRTNRVVATRAALSDDSKNLGKEVTVSILAASIAFGLGASVVDGAFANPIDTAKSKSSSALSGAKDAAPEIPSELSSAPSPGGAIEDAQKQAGKVASGVKTQIDGIFGKGKKGPLSKLSSSVTNASGGTGSALGDAQKRISEFGKNPIADNAAESSKLTDRIASAISTPQSAKVDDATKKVGDAGSDLQSKGKDAVSEGKGFLDKTQGSIPSTPSLPSLPNVFPKLDGSLLAPDTSAIKDFKGGVDSQVEGVKKATEGALPN